MNNIQVVAHTSFCGSTGYNAHSRNFFTHLNKLIPTRVRNYSYASPDELLSMTQEQLNMIIQSSWTDPPHTIGTPFNPDPNKMQVDIVLNESHHYYFYSEYEKPFIFYNVWESTKQLPEFFTRMLDADQFWCPTEFQKKCTIEQGYPEDRVKVVPEGVDGKIFLPGVDDKEKRLLFLKNDIPNNAFVFFIAGRWDYRKATEEMITAWHQKFGNDDNCYLVMSVDNPFSSDGFKTTEERLKHHNLEHERIRVLHFTPRDEYIKWLQYSSCLLQCSRSEGWGLPLIEAIACGTPTICSDWGAHLEFADGMAHKVQVLKELPPQQVFMLGDGHDLGVWGEPDFDHLQYVMDQVYKDFTNSKTQAIQRSKYIRQLYTWDNAARKAEGYIKELVTNKYHYIKSEVGPSKPKVSLVTSFYNSENYISDLVQSVFDQTFQDWEWIITDDFSEDHTKAILLDLCKIDPRIKYINQKFKQEIYWNPHKYATGDYVFVIDADDQLVPKTAEVISHLFESHPDVSCIHASGNYYLENFKKESFKNSSFCKMDQGMSILEKHPIYLENESGYERLGFMFGAIRAFRNPGPQLDFNDGDWKLGRHEDLVKLLRLEEMGKPLYLNRTLYKVRMHEDSNSGSWGDKGGETEFEKMYEVARKRGSVRYLHHDGYDSIREELYAFLSSDLNEEATRKKVVCYGFNIDREQQQMIRDIYFDHDFIFDEKVDDADYVFVYAKDITAVELYYEVISQYPSTKVLFFMSNHDWEPGFYDLPDGDQYFELFNEVRKYLLDKTNFMYGTYLYKYCFIKFITPERKKVKINLGCGNDIKPDYINVDKYNNTGAVDHQWDLSKLEVPDNSVDEIYTSHVFEHIEINDVYSVLEEWERALRPGGELVMRLPNLETEVKIWLEAPDDRKWFEVHRIFGSQSHEGNTHFSGHNPESLKSLIERFNFEVTSLGTGNRGFGEEIQLTAKKIAAKPLSQATYNTHFVDGPFAEVLGDPNDKGFYIFDFLDPDNHSSVHQQMMSINTWTRPHRRWFTNWLIRISRNGKVVHEHPFNCTGKRVLVSFDSKSLGDSIAWIPKVEEFRKKHNCTVIASTFWNKLFKKAYPEIEFIEPGTVVDNLYASYLIGCWEGNHFKNKVDWREVPLQHVASDILGLEHKEIVPRLGIHPGNRPIKEKYVAISEFSTFQCKFWNYPNAWQEIVDHLNELGYKVMSISKEKTKLKNVIKMNNKPIEQSITNIAHAEFFMGLSAGPTWLAWALKVPAILISGYSAKWGEFESNIQRVINEDVCHGCFNDSTQIFERGEWEWCPRLKGTERQFECSNLIAPQMVKDAIQNIINK